MAKKSVAKKTFDQLAKINNKREQHLNRESAKPPKPRVTRNQQVKPEPEAIIEPDNEKED